MTGFGLRKNMVFEWKGGTFRIERLQPNGEVLIESMDGGALSLVTRQQLLDDFAKGLISASVETPPGGKPPMTYSRPLDQLSPQAQKEVKRRRQYLEAITAHGTPVFTPEFLQPILQQVSDEIGDLKPPSATTIYRWYRRLIQGRDARSLTPRYDLRGRKNCQQSPRLLELLGAATTEAFNTTPLATGQNIYSRLLAKVDSENRQSLASTPLVAPSKRTMYRLLAGTNQYEMVALKEGKASADRRFRVGKAGTKTTRILERVEIDHTPLDLFLVDERTWLPLGRPTLTVVFDHYSRLPLGYYLTYGSPSAAAVVGALRHAILPKAPTVTVIEGLDVDNRWPSYGLPEVLVTDNGLEFHGIDLDSIAFDLGFAIVFCPKRQPRFKGSIERYLKTINYYFAHQLPGVSFARFHLRGDYDPQKCALLTLAEFKHLFEKWVVDVYAQTVHRSLGTTPFKRWNEGIAVHEPQLPKDLSMLQQRIGQSASRKLRRDGFELNGIRYNGDGLGPILRQYGEGVAIRVVFDPEDLGEVHVWGPDESDPILVQALNLAYARGLTFTQNTLIRQLMREEGANGEDPVALQRARNDIAQAVAELMTSRKQKARQRSASIRGITSSNPQGGGVTSAPEANNPAPVPSTTPKAPKNSTPISVDLPKILTGFQMQSPKRDDDGKP
ncbi:MAG: Mu transposase C-terminal domain-containing protein [Burkholderiaceae bacterium]|nr:Mu transposase C-terminal domain-containing protein [Burkholderiaceae bacterium]